MASGHGKAYANNMNWKLDSKLTPGPISDPEERSSPGMHFWLI